MKKAELLLLLAECEWSSAPHRDEGMCPICCGRQPLNDDDLAMPEFYGHRQGCEMYTALYGGR